MPCDPIIENGRQVGFACSRIEIPMRQRCQCGRPGARLLCDWKVPAKATGTCDKALCPRCTYKPDTDKDLCEGHAAQWKARLFGKVR